jgi:hypothetical protein
MRVVFYIRVVVCVICELLIQIQAHALHATMQVPICVRSVSGGLCGEAGHSKLNKGDQAAAAL